MPLLHVARAIDGLEAAQQKRVVADCDEHGLEQRRQKIGILRRGATLEQTAEDKSWYADAEEEARARRVGLWNEKLPVAPWEWRKR